jgi:hypothetical protein
MPRPLWPSLQHWRIIARVAALTVAAVALVACGDESPLLPNGLQLASGTWGGENAAMLVSDESAHVHVGCTYGNIPGAVTLDGEGRFELDGSYVLRAYPVAVGPSLPAVFRGTLVRSRLLLTIVVDDTVENRSVTLGPVQLVFGRQPNMGPCPICAPIVRDLVKPHV